MDFHTLVFCADENCSVCRRHRLLQDKLEILRNQVDCHCREVYGLMIAEGIHQNTESRSGGLATAKEV